MKGKILDGSAIDSRVSHRLSRRNAWSHPQWIDGWVVVTTPSWMYRTMVDGPMAAGRPWMLSAWRWVVAEPHHGSIYRAMVGGAVVADRCSAAWRWACSEFEEKTLSSLIQTGESFSSNLKHGPMVGDGRSLRRTDIIDRNLQY